VIRRFPDWQSRLDAYLRDMASTGFVWGETDCCMNAANAVRACTGTDPAAKFRGRYKTSVGAVRVLARATGCKSGLVERIAAQIAGDLGLAEIAPVYAQALDVAFLPFEDTLSLGGVLSFSDGQSFVVVTPTGEFTRLPFLVAVRRPGTRVWRV
jgi:hypothetical protein